MNLVQTVSGIFTSSSSGSSFDMGAVTAAAIGAYFTHSLSVRLGPVRITATDSSGAHARLTPTVIWEAGRKILGDVAQGKPLAQETFDIQVGNVRVRVEPWSTAPQAP